MGFAAYKEALNPVDDLPASAPLHAAETGFYGASQAAILSATLLLALAFVAAVRWFGSPATSEEQIVQVPVPVSTPKPLPPPEVLAPDPGDTP